MDYVACLHLARDFKRRAISSVLPPPPLQCPFVDKLLRARDDRVAARRSMCHDRGCLPVVTNSRVPLVAAPTDYHALSLPSSSVLTGSMGRQNNMTAAHGRVENPLSSAVATALRRMREARSAREATLDRHHRGNVVFDATAVLPGNPPALLSQPRSVQNRRGLLPVVSSCLNTAGFRESSRLRRVSLPPLDSEKARRLLVLQGSSQNKLQELQRGVVRAALALAYIIPAYALAQLLEVDLQTISIPEGIDAVVALVEGKGISAPYLTDIVNSWKSLIADMDRRQVVHCERARAFDVNLFLNMRDKQARTDLALPNPCAELRLSEAVAGAPMKRTRDGASVARTLLAKLKVLEKFFFDITTDKNRVCAPAPPVARLPKSVESAPTPSPEMVKMFQRAAADCSLPWAVRLVSFTCSLLTLAVLRAEQSSMFGILQIVVQPDGERVLIGKAKKKVNGLALEHFVLPLSGVLKDDGLWWDSCIPVLSNLPGGFQGFAARDFMAPYRTRNDPYTATGLSNNLMPQKRFDAALRFILQRELLLSADQASLYSQHSFRHFLPEVSAAVDPPDVANLNALELLRHSHSTLARSSHLAPADLARHKFVVSATSVSRVYVANKTMSRLIKISLQQTNRVHRALSRPAYVPSPFGGWEMLEK